jgi:RNA polymerase sigma-70 factor (ECF subfamily)
MHGLKARVTIVYPQTPVAFLIASRYPFRKVGAPPDDPRSDQQLIADISSGDSAAFDALYWRYRDWVVSLAYRFTSNHDDALDVFQETFAYLCGKFPRFKLTASMKTFLYPVVRNLSLEVRRKRNRVSHGGDSLDLLPAAPQVGDPRADLYSALANIPAMHREVLLMRFVDDLKLEEIAEALEIPLGTVKSRLHNGISLLREDPRARRYFLP